MVRLLSISIFLLLFHISEAQLYLIKFKYKKSSFTLSNPSAYLSQKSIDRRTRYSIPLDSTDLPINPVYIDSLNKISGVKVLNKSKWLNHVSVLISEDEALHKIHTLTFVHSLNIIAGRIKNPTTNNTKEFDEPPQQQFSKKISSDYYSYGSSTDQIAMHNGAFLHNIGLTGEGMIIGMLDAGYFNYTFLKAFDSINLNGQVKDYFDFVSIEKNVADNHPHGMYCLSTMAANIPDVFVGSAPKANFLLYRTEDEISEYPIEEHNWVCGAERIDSAGGDVISSSLGYTTFDNPIYNHTYKDLDGNKTIITIGADLAAKKGILVVNAAGNEGTNTWKHISAPADGDSVLAVGAVDGRKNYVTLSGQGPNYNGIIKPDVASLGLGVTIQNINNSLTRGNGTSYACPNLAGLITCLWAAFPEASNMNIISAIKQSSNNNATPNNLIGNGIPDVKKAFAILIKKYATVTVKEDSNCDVIIQWNSKEINSMKYVIERKLQNEINYITIAEIKSKENKLFQKQHFFIDTNLVTTSKKIEYRIFQVIDTSKSSYSKILLDSLLLKKEVQCNNTSSITIYPNPLKSFINIYNKSRIEYKNLIILIYNLNGEIVKQISYNNLLPNSFIKLSTDILTRGNYILNLYAENKKIITKKFIKVE